MVGGRPWDAAQDVAILEPREDFREPLEEAEPVGAPAGGRGRVRNNRRRHSSLADVDWACGELEWALEHDARVLVMRPSPIHTRDGWRPHTDERFDPFWSRVNEAGITVVAHVGSTAYTANGYGGNSALAVLGGGRKPTVAGMIPERAIYPRRSSRR
jgi:hypothetical protein